MTKQDLKTGMWVELRNGDRYLVIKDCDTTYYGHQDIVFIKERSFTIGDGYTNDLIRIDDNRGYDIVRVLASEEMDVCACTYTGEDLKVIWEREYIKTYKDVFLKAFPNCAKTYDGYPVAKCCDVFSCENNFSSCWNNPCDICWDKPYKE